MWGKAPINVTRLPPPHHPPHRTPLAVVRLVLLFGVIFPWRGDSGAALKSEAAVDGNRNEVADRGASVQARLGNRELENHAARACPSMVLRTVCFLLPGLIYLFLSLGLSFFCSLYLRILPFSFVALIVVMHPTPLVHSLRGA